jgi:hypothetical protein
VFFCKIQDASTEILKLKRENIALQWALFQAKYGRLGESPSAREERTNRSFFKVHMVDDENKIQGRLASDIVARAISEANLARAWSISMPNFNPGELRLQPPINSAESNCKDLSVNLILKFLSGMMRKEFPENSDVVERAVAAVVQGGLLDVVKTSKRNGSFPSVLKCMSDFLLESYSAVLDTTEKIDIRWASVLGMSVLSPVIGCSNSSGKTCALLSAVDDVLVAVLTRCYETIQDASTETSSRSMEVALSIQEVNPRVSGKLQPDIFESLCLRFPLFGFFATLYPNSEERKLAS